MLLSFTPSFQAFVLEGQRRLHSSLRQVSDGDADGDADADGWHRESDCSLLPHSPFPHHCGASNGAVHSPKAEVPKQEDLYH